MFFWALLLITCARGCLNPCIKEKDIKELSNQEMTALENILTELRKGIGEVDVAEIFKYFQEHNQKAADLKKINDEYKSIVEKLKKLEGLPLSVTSLKALVKSLGTGQNFSVSSEN